VDIVGREERRLAGQRLFQAVKPKVRRCQVAERKMGKTPVECVTRGVGRSGAASDGFDCPQLFHRLRVATLFVSTHGAANRGCAPLRQKTEPRGDEGPRPTDRARARRPGRAPQKRTVMHGFVSAMAGSSFVPREGIVPW
jgi:hypothetical protein